MTYHTPELLLIGAAANLVLEGSNQLKIHGDRPDCTGAPVDEFSSGQYDLPENW